MINFFSGVYLLTSYASTYWRAPHQLLGSLNSCSADGLKLRNPMSSHHNELLSCHTPK